MDPIAKALQRAQKERQSSPAAAGQQSVRSWVQPTTPSNEPRHPNLAVSKKFSLDADHLHANHVLSGTDKEDWIIADKYRLLRTRISQLMKQNDWAVIGITSPGPKAGKTLTATNLAIAMAREAEYGITLIDADLRKPSLGPALGVDSELSIIDHLQGDCELADVFLGVEQYPDLTVIPGSPGKSVNAPTEVLGSNRFRTMLETVRQQSPGQVVILDLAPTLVGDDVLAVAPLVDAFLVIIEENGTDVDELSQCIELLSDFNILGTVLNKSSEKSKGFEGYYHPRSED